MTTDGDSFASAPVVGGACPVAASPNFQEALTAGFGCIRLNVRDGGANDIDERRDGVVTLLLNIGSPIDLTGPTTTGEPDVVIAANSSGGGGSWFVPLLAVLMLLLRQRRLTLCHRV